MKFLSRTAFQTYEIPAIVIDGRDLGLEVYTTLARDDVMIAKTLIPGDLIEHALAVHVDPSCLEAENSASGEVDAAVVEVVADRNLVDC